MSVGIEDLAVYFPRSYVDLTGEFASSRKPKDKTLEEYVGKLVNGLGVAKMAIPDVHEDAVTMAANAAFRLIERNKLSPEQIGRISVGTESQVDNAKPIPSYLQGCLENKRIFGKGSLEHCDIGGDVVFACVGATSALRDTINWIRASDNEGRVGIVVATDVAKYDLHSNAEHTQGAGAVAMLVSEDPQLLALERPIGIHSEHERDFYKPKHRTTPVVDGKHSERLYWKAMRGAFDDYRRQVVESGLIKLNDGEALTDHVDHMIVHLPYSEMGRDALAYLLRHDWRGLPRWQLIIEEVENEPGKENFVNEDDFLKADREWRKKFLKTKKFQEAFEGKVKPSQIVSKQVGNAYAASMSLAFASMLEFGKHYDGQRVGLGSYGSGCKAMAMSGILTNGSEYGLNLNLKTMLESRRELSLEQYEALHRGQLRESVVKPHDEFALVRVGNIGDKDEGFRYYDFV